MVNDAWGIGADLAYHAWGGSDDLNAAMEATFGPGSEVSWSAIQADVHGVMMVPTQSNMKPYAQVGVGLYNVSAKLTSPMAMTIRRSPRWASILAADWISPEAATRTGACRVLPHHSGRGRSRFGRELLLRGHELQVGTGLFR
jgi:hypothetical protein